MASSCSLSQTIPQWIFVQMLIETTMIHLWALNCCVGEFDNILICASPKVLPPSLKASWEIEWAPGWSGRFPRGELFLSRRGTGRVGLCQARPLLLTAKQQLQAPQPRGHFSMLPCSWARTSQGTHCLSCTEMRLSLPSSCVTGWHPCKVSCTGAVEWGTGKSSSSGSCRWPRDPWQPWGAKA